eukprot:sb/3471185/
MLVFVALVVVQSLLVSCDSTLLVSGQESRDLESLLEEISARLERLEAKLAERDQEVLSASASAAIALFQSLLVSCDSTLLVSGQESRDLESLLEEISARLERLEAKLAERDQEVYEGSSDEIGEISYVKYTPYEPIYSCDKPVAAIITGDDGVAQATCKRGHFLSSVRLLGYEGHLDGMCCPKRRGSG